MAIKMRGKKLSLYKRVPKRYESVEPRKFIWLALHTDSQTEAERKAGSAWAQMIEAWEALLAGDSSDAETRFAAARDLAAARGFRYLRADDVARLPKNELLDRIAAIGGTDAEPDVRAATALLGTAIEPEITVSGALDLYWSLAHNKVLGKSEDQVRQWENPRKKAVRNFIEVVGDRPLSEITGDDMLDFRGWWLEKLETDGLTPNSANKDLIHLGDILKTVNKMKRLGLVLPLSDLSFKEGEAKGLLSEARALVKHLPDNPHRQHV